MYVIKIYGVAPSEGGADVGAHYHRGKALQVDPIKPTLKASGTKRLNLTYHKLLSSLAFKFNLRRYTEGFAIQTAPGKWNENILQVGRCRLSLSNPR